MKRNLILAMFLLVATAARAELVEKAVEYTQGGETLEGYLAYDDAVHGKRPGVLVVHEWWGLNDYIKKRAGELARMGYVAFAADMYGKGIVTTDAKKAGELAGRFRAAPQARERAGAALDVLMKQELVDSGRIAAIGFCFGGGVSLELAYGGAPLEGVVSFHSGLPAPGPEDYKNIKASILVLHGADDGFETPENIEAFQKAMRDAGADWEMVSYGGAVHSFTNPGADKFNIPGVAYNEKAANRSWALMKSFFDEIFARESARK
jgi:dienelactone hydrolase